LKKKEFRNIGSVSESWLNDVGIFTIKDLEKVGAKKACKMIQDSGHKSSLNLLYALIGAIHDEDWQIVAEMMRKKK
jgi:nucleotidyltransferase/DNA polymerase involved in DNA repair